MIFFVGGTEILCVWGGGGACAPPPRPPVATPLVRRYLESECCMLQEKNNLI